MKNVRHDFPYSDDKCAACEGWVGWYVTGCGCDFQFCRQFAFYKHAAAGLSYQ